MRDVSGAWYVVIVLGVHQSSLKNPCMGAQIQGGSVGGAV